MEMYTSNYIFILASFEMMYLFASKENKNIKNHLEAHVYYILNK